MLNKILITGTPRTGTTFLVQLYHEMGFETGFTDETHNIHQFSEHSTHGGLEYIVDSKNKHTVTLDQVEVIKHPWNVGQKSPWRYTGIFESKFRHIIITNRITFESLQSMERRDFIKSYGRGMYWNEETAIRKAHYLLANVQLRRYYSEFIEIDFPKSVRISDYLYLKLKPTLGDRVSKDQFKRAWKTIAKEDYVGRT